jgi:hypothetical protein
MLKSILLQIGKFPRDIAYIIFSYIPEICEEICIQEVKFPSSKRWKWILDDKYHFILIFLNEEYIGVFSIHGEKVLDIKIKKVKDPNVVYLSWQDIYGEKILYIGNNPYVANPIPEQRILFSADILKKLRHVPRFYPRQHDEQWSCTPGEILILFIQQEWPNGWYANDNEIGIRVMANAAEFHNLCIVLGRNNKCVIL